MKEDKKTAAHLPIKLFVFAAPFLIGVYHEWTAALTALFLVGYLCYCKVRIGEVVAPKSLVMLACTALTVFFAVSPLWAADRGMAFMGFVKFLPLPLFCMAMAQLSPEKKRDILNVVPLSGAVMTVLSALLCLIPVCRDYLLVSGRLGGFFQYPNTFAVFLLAGVFIQLHKGEKLNLQSGALCAVLLAGVFASGSRTAFVLMIGFAAVYLISKNKKGKLFLGGALGVLAVGAAAYALITGDLDTVGRYLTSSFTSGTLVGRILYYLDSLPVILTHPLGLGYMGYYVMQGSFQNGVYSVMNIHNDFLQILLDVGWIPAGICVAALISAVKKCRNACRYVILIIVLHSMLDFDLQFLAMDFVLILAAECEDTSCIKIKKEGFYTAAAVSAAAAIYLGTANMLYFLEQTELSCKVYPLYTMAYIQQLGETETMDEAEELADKILSLDKSVSLAYSAKARAEFSRGDILKMIEYKKQAISCAKYSIEEYRDYRYMLETAEQMYENAGDAQSAQYCLFCIQEIGTMLRELKENTSPLAFMIDDKPTFTID